MFYVHKKLTRRISDGSIEISDCSEKESDEKYRIAEVICKWTRYLARFCARLSIIIAAMIRRQVVSASSFFFSSFFRGTSALVRELERINEWHARPFLCSFAESSAASSQKVTRDETDFWRGSMGRDNARGNLCISRVFCTINTYNAEKSALRETVPLAALCLNRHEY